MKTLKKLVDETQKIKEIVPFTNELVKSKNFKFGIFDITNEQYHASPGISRSGIKELKRSPLHYWYAYVRPDREAKESSDAMEFGTAFHMYVLEPELFEKTYFVSIKCPHHGSSNKAKDYKVEELLKAKGKTIITDVDMKKIRDMTDGLYSHPKAFKLISGGIYEKSFYWIDEESGILCKARPDIFNEQGKFIVDLKTTKDGNKKKFSYDFQDGANYIQCAMIRDAIKVCTGVTIENFLNLAVEKEAPYVPVNYPVNNQYVNLGEQEYKHHLKILKECLEKNEWQGYQDDEINVPNYLVSEWQA